jgi:hypothetical protein
MKANSSNIKQLIISELKISEDEAISSVLGWSDEQRALAAAKSLVSRGMVIEITKTEFESLHPRFAITNRYRRRCEEDRIPFKKNLKIDNLGLVLEKPYEDARTK